MPTGVYERKPRTVAAGEVRARRPMTKAQRKVISDRLKAFHANKRGNTNGSTRPAHRAPELSEAQVAYALGRVEGWLEAYADSLGVSGHAAAERVGELLHTAARRKGVGA